MEPSNLVNSSRLLSAPCLGACGVKAEAGVDHHQVVVHGAGHGHLDTRRCEHGRKYDEIS